MLITKKITILTKYLDFIDIFFKKLIIKLFEYLNINEYAIKLKVGKQVFYKLIYIFRSIELETFKIYIKTNLANNFIKVFKSFSKVLILFTKILNKSIYLHINY